MVTLVRTNSKNGDFKQLVELLDQDLAYRDGKDHIFYDQFNKIDNLKYVVVACLENKPIGCGAMKEFQPDSLELKRMYVLPSYRARGVAKRILFELEDWARELKYGKCILETGKKQTEAINLYQSNKYKIIPNYGQYLGIENSICFEKYL